ncbi:hypothetical protein NDU88_004729, partial [Pleurodeles waltl]
TRRVPVRQVREMKVPPPQVLGRWLCWPQCRVSARVRSNSASTDAAAGGAADEGEVSSVAMAGG